MNVDNLVIEGIDRIILQDLSLFRSKIRAMLLDQTDYYESRSSTSQYHLQPFFSIYKTKNFFVRYIVEKIDYKYVLVNHRTKELFFINSDIKDFFTSINYGNLNFDNLQEKQKVKINTFVNIMIRYQFIQINSNNNVPIPNLMSVTKNDESIIQSLNQFKYIHTIIKDYNKSVFLLENSISGKQYILKCLNNTKDQIQVDIFHNEIEILNKLKECTFINKIYLFNSEKFYVIVEYVDGIDLGEYLFYYSITLAEKLNIIHELVELLSNLHSKNIIHGDIHIDQFRLNENGQIFLLDFGLAHDLNTERNRGYTISGGSYEYLEPESIIPEPFNFHIPCNNYKCSEVYRIGILLYYIIYDKYPFSDISWRLLYYNKTTKDIELPALTKEGEPIPQYIIQILKNTLNKVPEDRFQSAEEIYSFILKYK